MLIISLHADSGSLGAHSPAVWGIAEMGVGTSSPLSFPEDYQLQILKDLAVGTVLVIQGE